ncbi:hypothetical protein ALC57_15734 [Trachymyrmex cornetzi]|uniref:Uncharacterized protein n=1 Tax=Trachymyrmex cornetzi TaxID=471704 RepID=A0A151IW96_9HYME|nr:hypothetical protein ALC57_15734 [Trachymyrmex cornetzi]
MEEFRKSHRRQENKLLELIEEIRGEYNNQKREWEKEREEIRKDMKEMKNRVEILERSRMQELRCIGTEAEGEQKGGEGFDGQDKEENNLEEREREKRRRNIIIKGIQVREGRREAVEEILGEIGVKVEAKEIRKIGEGTERGKGEMLLIKLENEEQKREVMGEKNLKGRKERIWEDLTWRERKIRYGLGEIAKKEMAEGKRVWVRGGRIRIEGRWWRWDEEREALTEEGGIAEGNVRGWGERR